MDKIIFTQLSIEELRAIIKDCLKTDTTTPTKDNSEEVLLSKEEIKKLFNVSLVTVSDWMKSGKLPYFRMQRRVYFRKSEINKVMSRLPSKYKNRILK